MISSGGSYVVNFRSVMKKKCINLCVLKMILTFQFFFHLGGSKFQWHEPVVVVKKENVSGFPIVEHHHYREVQHFSFFVGQIVFTRINL